MARSANSLPHDPIATACKLDALTSLLVGLFLLTLSTALPWDDASTGRSSIRPALRSWVLFLTAAFHHIAACVHLLSSDLIKE